MSRFFLVLFLCAIFIACSSDDSASLNDWFSAQGLATSYNSYFEEFDVVVESSGVESNDSAYLVSSYAALGNVNGIEQSLYFGLEVLKSSDTSWINSLVWKLRTDSLFYDDFYGGVFPYKNEELDAKIYWYKEGNVFIPDSSWLKSIDKGINYYDSTNTTIEWENGGGGKDTLLTKIPSELLDYVQNEIGSLGEKDTLRLMVSIKLVPNSNKILRIAPPSIYDVPNLLRVAQKTDVTRNCGKLCLHSGVRDSLYVSFKDIGDLIDTSKTLVFAQLILNKNTDTKTGNELGNSVPVYVYSKLYNANDTTTIEESYRVDTAYVKENYHTNLLFSGEDTLKLQVTKKLRHYANSDNLPDTLFLMLGYPVLKPQSIYFYNHYDENSDYVKVISGRSSFSEYDFTEALDVGKKVKLRLWYAVYDENKK